MLWWPTADTRQHVPAHRPVLARLSCRFPRANELAPVTRAGCNTQGQRLRLRLPAERRARRLSTLCDDSHGSWISMTSWRQLMPLLPLPLWSSLPAPLPSLPGADVTISHPVCCGRAANICLWRSLSRVTRPLTTAGRLAAREEIARLKLAPVTRLVPRSQNDPGSWIRKIQDLCILKILDPIATFCRKILKILDPIETFWRKILKILDSIETFCRKTLNILDPTVTFCRQILKILDPAQTLLRWFLEILDLGQTICRGIFNILDSWTMYPIDLRPHGWTPFHYVQQHSLSLISWFSWS